MNPILRLFRFHKLSIIRLNKVITILLLAQMLLGTLTLTAVAVLLYDEQPEQFSDNPLIWLFLAFTGYMYIRLYMFSRRHWWSWCVFTVLSVYGLAAGLAGLINWAIPYHFAVSTEEIGYLPTYGIMLLEVVGLLLSLVTVAGLTSYRIAGFHGIGKVAFWVSCAAGIILAILVVTYQVA
jgi:hypothetical protein